MNRIDYITAFLCGTMAFAGCDKQMEEIPEVILPTDGYIHFNTEVASRGALVTDMKGQNFVVTAYNYKNNVIWSTVELQAKPNVFYNQSVKWNGAVHTYDAFPDDVENSLKTWEAGKRYAFFAHYPVDPSSITLSDSTYEGTPYITYTLPSTENATELKDVMTAHLLDTDNSTSNEVGLTFKHRLAALDVQARNFNDPLDNETEVYIRIDSMKIKISNLAYNQIEIPLDASMEVTRKALGDWRKTAEYNIIPSDSSVVVAPSGSSSGEETSIGVSDAFDTNIIIIPQEAVKGANGEVTGLKGMLELTYEYVDSNGDGLTIEGNPGGSQSIEFDTKKDLKAGRKYYLQMTFSRSAITIAIIESGAWEDKDVEIEFE